ncbi:hypothetical protein Esti_002571 [Eimeria stiedai]
MQGTCRDLDIFQASRSTILILHEWIINGNIELRPGDSVNTPAEDCFEAKASDPEASSGFYWILPPCAPQPLRVFCDMLTSTSMYFWRNDRGISGQMSKVHSVPSLRLRCAEKGLEPLVLSSPAQLRALRVALEQLGMQKIKTTTCRSFSRPHVDIGCDAVAAQHPAFFGITNDCPIESLSSIATSFLDLQSLGRLESNAVKTPNEKAEDVLIDPAVAALINEVLQVMDEVHGLDPSSVFGAQSSAADAVAALEEELKPAEALQKKTFKETGELLLQAEGGAATLLNVSGSLSNKLDDLITQLEKVERQRQSQIGFESFALNYTRASFNDTFETHDTLRTAAGPSSWGYAEVPLEGRRVTIGQSSPIRGKGPAEGTFAILKSHRFFDGVLHADFNVRCTLGTCHFFSTLIFLFFPDAQAFGKGTVGIAFRTRDPQNTFLLSFNAEEESIKLIRVEDGEASVVAKAEEGSPAYREAAWQRVRVELHHGHIKVAVSEEKGVWKPIIDARRLLRCSAPRCFQVLPHLDLTPSILSNRSSSIQQPFTERQAVDWLQAHAEKTAGRLTARARTSENDQQCRGFRTLEQMLHSRASSRTPTRMPACDSRGRRGLLHEQMRGRLLPPLLHKCHNSAGDDPEANVSAQVDAESELHAELLEKARKNRPQEVRECQRHCQSVTAANAIRVDA